MYVEGVNIPICQCTHNENSDPLKLNPTEMQQESGLNVIVHFYSLVNVICTELNILDRNKHT